jgi:N-acetylneuraminic acid mutarotase
MIVFRAVSAHMKRSIRANSIFLLAVMVLVFGMVSHLSAQNSAFTYQGQLTDKGAPANGLYDFTCGLYATNTGGVSVTTNFSVVKVPVTNGLFTVMLDFDPAVFTGNPLYLELQVSPAGAGKFSPLLPRQLLTSAPYAFRSASALLASHATTADVAASATLASSVTPGSINAQSLAVSSVNTANLGNNAVINTKINDGAVSTSKLADNAVTTLKIFDAAVTGPKIASGAVGSTNIANGAVGAAQMASNAVGTANLMAGAVTATQLGAGAAVANLMAGGQSAVPSGGIVLSASGVGSQNLINAGYVKIGTVELAREAWTTGLNVGPTNTGSLLAPRVGHTAVWTGSEMIIWGGYDGAAHNNGARYNPAANSWTVINPNSGLAPRNNHVATWTGSIMVIWGGSEGSTAYGDGACYNPTTDSWTSITTSGAPSARTGATAVWSGSRMIVWGGGATVYYPPDIIDPAGHSDFVQLPTGKRYDPSNNVWTSVSQVNGPTGALYHTAVWSGSQMLVFGGDTSAFSGGRYNPVTDVWSNISTNNAPSPRSSHTAIWNGTNMIVWGGYTGGGGWFGGPTNSDGAQYNPVANTWTTMSTVGAPSGRYNHSAVWTGSRMIIWGGDPLDGVSNSSALTNGATYNPAANSWTTLTTANQPSLRSLHTAVWTGTEMIVWGGEGDSGYPEPGGRYNLAANTWQTMTPAPGTGEPAERQRATAVWTGSEMIVWGGENSGFSLRTGGRYNPVANTWNNLSLQGAPSGRQYHTAVWTGSQMLIWGGLDSIGTSGTGARYNPLTDKWTAIASSNAPAGRAMHVAAWTDSEMLIWGGWQSNPTNIFSQPGGKYNPTTDTWKTISNTNQPPIVAGAAAVWTGNEMLVWGGQQRFTTTNYFATGGRYNPVTDSWSTIPTLNAPSARSGHTAVWTGTDYLVFGGKDATTNLNTGARYNVASATWIPISLTNAPSARSQHVAVWTGSDMIIWGGYAPIGGSFNYNTHGAIYNLQSGLWSTVASDPDVLPSANPCAVWTGSQMLVWGGLSDNNQANGYLATPCLYSPQRTMDLMLRP